MFLLRSNELFKPYTNLWTEMTEGTKSLRNTDYISNKFKLKFSYGKLVTYMNDGTSLKSVRQIRQTDNLQSIIWVTLEHS